MRIKDFILVCITTAIMFPMTTLKAQNMEKEKQLPEYLSAFPLGEENVQYARFFIGKSYLAPLTSNKDLNTPVCNVTFEPGCRNNWHSHTGGAPDSRRRKRILSGKRQTGTFATPW